METKPTNPVLVGVVALIVGLLVGGGGAAAYKNSQDSSMMASATPVPTAVPVPTTATKAADLRVVLNSLEKEHVELASIATKNGFDGRPDFAASAASLDANSVALAGAVGSVYGQAAGDKFLTIWRSHITFFVNYTVAAKKGDKAGMDKAVSDLGGYEDAIADFFSQANENLPRDAVHSLVAEHVGLLKSVVDAHGAADYTKAYAQQDAAYVQIGKIADAISGAIVKQNPTKF
jgi:hypothetical protein